MIRDTNRHPYVLTYSVREIVVLITRKKSPWTLDHISIFTMSIQYLLIQSDVILFMSIQLQINYVVTYNGIKSLNSKILT